MSGRAPLSPRPASPFTAEANAAAVFSFDDRGDVDRATRGLVAQLGGGRVMLGDHVVFDVAEHAFVTETDEVPDTVHPGLWRQARLNVNHGLFEVADGVWQCGATTSPTSPSLPATTAG